MSSTMFMLDAEDTEICNLLPLLEVRSSGRARHTNRKMTQKQMQVIPKIIPLIVSIHVSALLVCQSKT